MRDPASASDAPANPGAGRFFPPPLCTYWAGKNPLEKPPGPEPILEAVPQPVPMLTAPNVQAEFIPRNLGGRPAHQPTEATRREVRGAAAFIPHEAIAALVGISNKTLLKHYREELDLGDAQGCARGAMVLSKLIEEGSEKGSAHDLLEIAR